MNVRKLLVLGSSVALRVRPTSSPRYSNKPYAQLTEEYLNLDSSDDVFIANNISFSRAIVKEYLNKRDVISGLNPEYIIINLGIVDAPSRDIPLWFSDIIFKRKWKILFPSFSFLYNNFFKGNTRRFFTNLRFRKSWVSEKSFKKDFNTLIETIKRESFAKIIIIGINKGSQRIENELPGTLVKIERYNTILKELSKTHKLKFISTSDLESETYFPDGVHYNTKGHKYIAKLITSQIQSDDPIR